MIDQVIRTDKSKTHLNAKGKKAAPNVFKNSANANIKGRQPSRTEERWRPARIVAPAAAHADGDVGYLENIAAIGNEPCQNLSPEPKVELHDQIYVNQNYSSIHSSTKINRKSMDSLSSKNPKKMMADNPAGLQEVKSSFNKLSIKSPQATINTITDLPAVAKQSITV